MTYCNVSYHLRVSIYPSSNSPLLRQKSLQIQWISSINFMLFKFKLYVSPEKVVCFIAGLYLKELVNWYWSTKVNKMSTSPFTKKPLLGPFKQIDIWCCIQRSNIVLLGWRIQKCCPQQSNSLEPTLDGFAPFFFFKRKGQPLKITGNTWKQQVLDRECRVFVNKIKGSKNSMLRWAKHSWYKRMMNIKHPRDGISFVFLSVFAFYFGGH